MPQNKVTYGLRNLHIAFKSATQTGNTPTYDTPIAVPGLVRLAPTTVGDSSTFYADDGAYYTVTANNGYTLELEIALLPDALAARMFGWKIDKNGMLVETSDGKPEKFAFMAEVQGDQRNRRFVYYDNQASRPAKERTTKGESVEVGTDTLNLTCSPILVGDQMIIKGDMELNESNATAYNEFFDKVYIPDFTTGGAA